MTTLSLNDVWNDTAAFVKREWRLLFPIALLLNALPMAFASAMLPRFEPGRTPALRLSLLAIPVAAIIGFSGPLALIYLALAPGRSVGEGLRRALSRFLPLFALYLLVGLAVGLLFTLVAVIGVLLVPGLDPKAPSPGALAGFALILIMIMLPILLFVSTRLLLVAPVAAAEEGGPLAIARRSFALTRPFFWPLLGFLVLSSILSAIINMVANAVVGIPILLVAGPPEPGELSAVLLLLVSALVSTVVSVYLVTMVARIYLRLARGPDTEVFA